ncbi:hypothetical protein [uncultured Tateyamaria sp.]|uniref:hypothetical protein n=1 Tax=uncultured Tateyamaria sp. TaxID=455651 RepID=UPI002608AA75|nr:hypothetical protein [uncultured Tateyamaria sp.]
MVAIDIHPSELAYAFAYAKIQSVIGWGDAPFLPEDEAALAGWGAEGEERLRAAGHLIGEPETGLNFTDEMTSAIMALINPSIVVLAERKAGDQAQCLSVHVAGAELIGLVRRPDGMFEMTRYTDFTAAAGACAGFVGATLDRLEHEARIETDHKTLATLHGAAGNRPKDVIAALVGLGLSEVDAASATRTFAEPAAAGVLSVSYCAGNVVQDVEPITAMTSADGETWIIFPPASMEGPMVLERSSVGALTARVAVTTAARVEAAS